MRWCAIPLALLLAACGGGRAPDDAAIKARLTQTLPNGADGVNVHAIRRGTPHDATAAEASAGDIPRAMTVWPVEVSASFVRAGRTEQLQRSFLFYRKSDGGWVGVNGPGAPNR